MRTAVDSSVLLDVLLDDPVYGDSSSELLFKALQEGVLVGCEVVWAEIRPRFDDDHQLLSVIEKTGLDFDPMDRKSALLAGQIYKAYKQAGGKKEKMIPDFLIAAHASLQADRLLTRDRGFYRQYFPKLNILSHDF